MGEPSAPGRPSPLPDAEDEARDGGDEALLTAARRAAGHLDDTVSVYESKCRGKYT
jgi:hypothetical protein